MQKLVKFFLFAYLLVFPFGQLARLPISFFGPEVRVYSGDVLVGLAVGSWGVERVKRAKGEKKGKKKRPALAGPILAFAGAATLSLLVNIPRLVPHETLVASFYLLRWIIYAGLYFVVRDIEKLKTQNSKVAPPAKPLATHGKSTCQKSKLFNLLIFTGGLTAAFGLLQYFLFPDLIVWLEARHWDPHYFRTYGTFFDPGYFGIIMVLTLILAISQTLNSKFEIPNKFQILIFKIRNKKTNFPKYYILSVVCYLALMLTYSRASYLAYLVGMGVIAWKLKKPKFYAGVLAIFALTLLLLPRPGGEGVRLEREASIKARIINWKQSLIIAKDHPIFGVGFNTYRYAQRDYVFLNLVWQESHAGAGADSSLLFVLAITGAVGLIAYLWLLKSVFDVSGLKTDSSGYNLVVLASFAALLAHSLFLNSLFYPWIMAWMWILLASI